MSRISRVEGNEEVSQQVLRFAEQKIFAMQKNGYGPLAIMYYLAEEDKIAVSLTGYEDGYVATIS